MAVVTLTQSGQWIKFEECTTVVANGIVPKVVPNGSHRQEGQLTKLPATLTKGIER